MSDIKILDTNYVEKSTRGSRKKKAVISSLAIEHVKRHVELLKPYELSATQRLKTYQSMLRDDAVWAAIDNRTTHIEKAQAKGYLKYDKNSAESVKLAEFFTYIMQNMELQTPRGVGNIAASMLTNGVAFMEKVLRKGEAPFADKWVLENLSQIHPLSLDAVNPTEISEDGRRIINLRQSLNAFQGNLSAYTKGIFSKGSALGVINIDYRKVAVCAYGATSSQPLGVSPLDACYTAWREKVLLQDYTLVGVTKDFAGTPILYMPAELLEKADLDPTGPEADLVNSLNDNMANMHAGDQTYMILPSDAQSDSGTGLRDYDIKFLGVEGGGKGFDTHQLVEQRKKAIFTVLGSPNLIVGEEGGGSFNLLEGQSNIQAHYVERDNTIIDEMWNKQVFPTILKVNSMKPKATDIPVWIAGDIQPVSLETFTSGVQKLGAAAVLPTRDPDFVNEVLERAGFTYRIDAKDPKWLDKMSEDTSRAGDGMKGGLNDGVGKSTSTGKNRSVSNKG